MWSLCFNFPENVFIFPSFQRDVFSHHPTSHPTPPPRTHKTKIPFFRFPLLLFGSQMLVCHLFKHNISPLPSASYLFVVFGNLSIMCLSWIFFDLSYSWFTEFLESIDGCLLLVLESSKLPCLQIFLDILYVLPFWRSDWK